MSRSAILIICIVVFAFVLRGSNVMAEWEFQESGTTENLYDICFSDEYHGWAVGDNSTIIATTDGGVTWMRQECPVDGLPLRQIQSFPSQTAYCYGTPPTIHLHEYHFFKTVDGGNTWLEMDLGYGDGRIIDMFFYTDRTGWLIFRTKADPDRYEFRILYTNNAGETWDSQFSIIGKYELQLYSVVFENENSGWVFAWDDNADVVLCKTENGSQWTQIKPDPYQGLSPGTVRDLHTFDENTLAADIRGVKISRDSGYTWENPEFDFPKGYNPPDYVSIIDSKQAFLLGSYLENGTESTVLYKTDDAGKTIYDVAVIPCNKGEELYKIYALDEKHVWLTGYLGRIVKYTDDTVGVSENDSIVFAPVRLLYNSPNPFNASTTIRYNITQPGNVSLTIYSVSGQKVATLVDGFMPAGTHAAVFDGSSLASGLYLYRFEATGYAKTGKIMLVK